MSRSRRKLDTSPIEYDDVVDSPALKGMVSFLEIPPGELPRLDFTTPIPNPQKEGIPQTEPLDSGTPTQTTPPLYIRSDEGNPLTGAPLSSTPESTPVLPQPRTPSPHPPLTGIPFPSTPSPAQASPQPPAPGPQPREHSQRDPSSGIPSSPTPVPALASPWPLAPPGPWPPVLSRPLSRIRRAILAQDGHSFGEQALYDALWQHAHPRDTDTRIITLGYRRMSELARLTVNNCKANIQALIQKLAVEEIASFTHSQGRTYLVYNYSAIIQRRREAGLTHYIKSRGVVFVDPDTGTPLTERIRDRSGIPFSGGPLPGPLPEGDTKGTPEPAVSGAPFSSATPYSQTFSNFPRNPASSTPTALIQGLRQIVDPIDDEAAAVLWRQCRKRAEDCTVEEVLHFARAKATIIRGGRIQNPTGFLLASVPKCFEGASFLEYRREQAERAREAEEQLAQMRREFEAVLNDPNSSDEDRQFARRMLSNGGL